MSNWSDLKTCDNRTLEFRISEYAKEILTLQQRLAERKRNLDELLKERTDRKWKAK